MSDFAHFIDIVARPQDEDELGHVSNLVFLRWVLDAARAHSDAAGYDGAAYRRLGAAFVVRKHELEYLQPVYAGDHLHGATWVETWRGASCVRQTVLTRADDRVVVARASTLWAFIAVASGRPQRISPDIRAAFARHPDGSAPLVVGAPKSELG
jgi:acyl-CoA thioester hydrolase